MMSYLPNAYALISAVATHLTKPATAPLAEWVFAIHERGETVRMGANGIPQRGSR